MCAALSHVCRRRCQPATAPPEPPAVGKALGRSGAARHGTPGRAPRRLGAAMLCRKAVAGLNPRDGAAGVSSRFLRCPIRLPLAGWQV